MPTVLVVEDDQPTRNLLATALARAGVAVGGAQDGGEALEILDSAETPCRVIIFDLLMPRVDGRQFLNQLALRPGPRPMIILITAAVGFEEIPASVDLVVKKPFDIAALTTTVVNILRGGAATAPLDLPRVEPEAPAE